jgi:NAD(P)-dependent dehydrogenase (short-subunit alcohol dehydrogenase family)
MSDQEFAAAGKPTAEGAVSLEGATALVTGASRGFGRAIAAALCAAGAIVIGGARDRTALEEVRARAW